MAQIMRCLLILFLIFSIPIYAQETYQVLNAVSSDTVAASDTSATIVEKTIKPEEVKIAVAVLELDPNGVTDSEARALSDRLRIEIFNAGKYEVMERDKMNRILDEMKLQLNDCTTDECAIEIGRLIGVKKIIAGSISKVGEFFTVSARLIDVETSKIEGTAIEDIEGSLGIVLTQAMPSIAQKISGLSGKQIVITPIKTVVNINVEPQYSKIFINGEYRGESPLRIELEPADNYTLKVVREGYVSYEKSFGVVKGQPLDMNIALSKIVEPEVIVKEVPKKKQSISKGFRLKYISTGSPDKLNDLIMSINDNISDHIQMYKQTITPGTSFPALKSFDGIEVYNTSSVNDNIGVEFGLGIYRGNLDDWFSDIGKEKNPNEFTMVTWSPQVMLDLRFAPIRYPLFYPFFDVGFGYNLLFMNAYYDEESLGGPVYQSWGFSYGIGFEVRPLKVFGVAIEWNRKNIDMQLMDIDEVTDNFSEYGLDRVDLTKNRIGIALNFYY